MAEVEIVNVTKRWGKTTALSDLSLSVADREFLVLLGPSGCGKTTTMRMVAGLDMPSQGRIRIGGNDVTDLEPGDRDVAMVFQSYGLYPQMTVYENIRFPLRARSVPKAEHAARVRQAAEMVELEDYLDRKPAALSGGQRQRVALARAIVRSPQVFLMDEPLSNLDARLRVTMRAQIKALHERLRTTTIYVTHDQLEAMTLADRVVVMNGGEIEQIGTPKEIYDRPASTFVAGFVGSPAMNLIEGRVEGGRFQGPGGALSVSAPDGASRILGVRPEDLAIATPDETGLKGVITAIEMVGDATLAIVDLGKVNIIAKLPREAELKQTEHITLAVRGTVHVFDSQTGRRL